MNSKSGGISFIGLLTIVFITLKLAGTITWSWWWVLAPAWVPAAFAGAVLGSAFLVYLLLTAIKSKRS